MPTSEASFQARIDHLVQDMLTRGIRLEEAAREFEHRYIAKALEKCDGCKLDAAKLLGLHRNTLASRLANHEPKARRRRKRARR